MKRPLAYLTAAWSGEPDVDMEMGAFSISLAQTGRIPHREAARGNTPIPSKRLPSLMSGMARGAVSLHGKHPFQRCRRNAQPSGNRNIVFHILVHNAAADNQSMGTPQHIQSNHIIGNILRLFAFFQGIKLCPDLLIHICGHSRDPF